MRDCVVFALSSLSPGAGKHGPALRAPPVPAESRLVSRAVFAKIPSLPATHKHVVHVMRQVRWKNFPPLRRCPASGCASRFTNAARTGSDAKALLRLARAQVLKAHSTVNALSLGGSGAAGAQSREAVQGLYQTVWVIPRLHYQYRLVGLFLIFCPQLQ